MPRHYFFLAEPDLRDLATLAEQVTDQGGMKPAVVPEWANILPEPDGDGLIISRDKRILHIDSLEKLAKRSNAALKKQGGGGPVDADHKLYGGWFTSGGGSALGWAEEFEARPGKGLWARTMWLPEGEQLISSRKYRYTSSVVSGAVKAEVDEEAWSVTWHIYPELVEGFGITNIPALTTKAMFAERPRDDRGDLLALVLAKLGLRHDAALPEVREAFKSLRSFSAPRLSATEAGDTPPRNPEKPTQPPDEPPQLKKDTVDEANGAKDLPAKDLLPALAVPPTFTSGANTESVELSAARKRIASLELEATTAFVTHLVHTGRMTPAQKPAALSLASTPDGLAKLKELYQDAPPIIGTTPAPTTATATNTPHGGDPLAYELARQGMPATDIAARLVQRDRQQQQRHQETR